MSYAFQIDPREVLGVGESASLSDLHEAYRKKSKKLHPDVGGEEWAFRILTRSYEILSTARVMGRADEEMRREEAVRTARKQPTPTPNPDAPNPFSRVEPSRTSARVGVRDRVSDPSKLVAVELLVLRYEMDGPLGLLAGAQHDRNLSCTLNLSWPAPESPRVNPISAAVALQAIQTAFEAARQEVPPQSLDARFDGDHFSGLLSYGSALKADEAFKILRKALNSQDYGVVQTIMDLTIPRDWRR